MKEIQNELKKAYEILQLIYVNGDGVDMMAAAKSHIRKAVDLAKEGENSDGR